MNYITPIHIIFYLYAIVAVISSVMVVTAKNPVRSVLSLVVTFFAMAGVWMILHAEFLAIILVLVYVGAVMTLFLFVVMMLDITKEREEASFVHYLPLGILLILLMMGLLFITEGPHYFGFEEMPLPAILPQDYNNVAVLGSLLYTTFAYPFEVAGLILLASMIAAIALAHRAPYKRKVQSINKQVNISPKDRVELVDLKLIDFNNEETKDAIS